MTQLIVNKPRRRALIATLLHFCPSRRVLQPQTSSLQPQDSNRLRCRLEFAVTSGKQTTARISNRRKSAIFSPSQICADRLVTCHSSRITEFLLDTASRLEIDLTPYKINTDVISNRRWIRGVTNRKFNLRWNERATFARRKSQFNTQKLPPDFCSSRRGGIRQCSLVFVQQNALSNHRWRNPKRYTAVRSVPRSRNGRRNQSCSMGWAGRQEKIRPQERCFFS